MTDRTLPTHHLVIDVPLNLGYEPGDEELQIALKQALDLALSIAKVGTVGAFCDDTVVTLKDAE